MIPGMNTERDASAVVYIYNDRGWTHKCVEDAESFTEQASPSPAQTLVRLALFANPNVCGRKTRSTAVGAGGDSETAELVNRSFSRPTVAPLGFILPTLVKRGTAIFQHALTTHNTPPVHASYRP